MCSSFLFFLVVLGYPPQCMLFCHLCLFSSFRCLYTTQAAFKALEDKLTACGFVEEGGATCSGYWRVVYPRDGRPLVGCSGWRPGDLPTRAGGHVACKIKDGSDAGLLHQYNESGPPADPQPMGAQCSFIAPRHNKGRVCSRHGGEETALVRAGEGQCPVRPCLLYPAVVTDPTSVRVILILFGEDNHIFPVCKPFVSAIEKAVADQPNPPVRDLQVRFYGVCLVGLFIFAESLSH